MYYFFPVWISPSQCKPLILDFSSSPSLQGKDPLQLHQPEPAAPVSRQGPDQLPRPVLGLHHPGHLPALLGPTQQEAQALPGAQELQGQLQHTGKHPLTITGRLMGRDMQTGESLESITLNVLEQAFMEAELCTVLGGSSHHG